MFNEKKSKSKYFKYCDEIVMKSCCNCDESCDRTLPRLAEPLFAPFTSQGEYIFEAFDEVKSQQNNSHYTFKVFSFM